MPPPWVLPRTLAVIARTRRRAGWRGQPAEQRSTRLALERAVAAWTALRGAPTGTHTQDVHALTREGHPVLVKVLLVITPAPPATQETP